MMKFKHSRLILMTVVLIIVSFLLTTALSVHSLHTVIKGNNEELSKVLAAQIYDSINNRLSEPIAVAQTMASDHFLMESMENEDFPNEEEAKQVVSYLSKLSTRMNYSSAFIISQKSGKYYSQSGFNKIVDPLHDAHDVWYSTFISTGRMVDLDLDTDQAHGDKWTVFVNARIVNEKGELLGVCGVSVEVSDLQEILSGFVNEYNVHINLINDEDAIRINEGQASIDQTVLTSTKLKEYAGMKDYLYEELPDGGYIVRKYMDNMDWLLEIEDDNEYENSLFASLIYRNTFLFVLIMIILIIIVSRSIAEDRRRSDAYTKEIEKFAEAQEILKAKAETANRAKGDFVAHMSHEIRTPINAILGFDEMIIREAQDPDIREYAARIRASGRNLLSLINDVLDFSRIESGKMDIVPVSYSTVSFLSDLIVMIGPRAEAKGLIIHKEIDPNLPQKLYGDDVRLRQVITNLLINAVKYTEKGSITFSVKVSPMTDQKILLHVSVKDTGIGIRDEEKDKLFESFRRVDESRNRNIEGSGLGLSIASKTLSLMDSRLELESTYGKGSDFHFDLKQGIMDPTPVGDFEKAFNDRLSLVEDYHESFEAPSARILVVDDIDMNLLLFRGLLKKTAMTIDTAMSGKEAMEKIRKTRYDLIFLDDLMPIMAGVETLEKMKKEMPHAIRDIPIIVLTANAISGAREAYLSEGFWDYLSKPIEGKVLERMCMKWLPKEKVIKASGKDKAPMAEKKEPETLIDEKLGLSYCMDSRDFYKEMIGSFLEAGHMEKLKKLFEAEDWHNYQIAVHGLKSSSLALGAKKLSDLAKACELSLKNGEGPGFVKEHQEELSKLYDETLAELRKILESS